MRKPIWFGVGVLTMAVAIGCSNSPEDATMKEMLALSDQLTAEFEKVTDGKSFEAAMSKMVTEFPAKIKPLEEKAKSWSKEKQDEMKKKYESQIKAAEAKLQSAMKSAMQKAGPDALKGLGEKLPF